MFGKTLNTKTLARITSALLLTMLLISAMPCTVFAGENKDMITSFTDLKTAIRAAKDGDTLYVGDIDFTPSGDMFKLIMRIEADKNLTIKSGKSDGKAVFTNGSFILSGAKTDDGRNTFHFEDIIFDGGVDTSKLTVADFDLQWSEEEQRYLLEEPRDILEIPYIKTTGCILIDDGFATDFQHHELPSEDNGYNYVASPGDATADGLNITCPDSPTHLFFDIPKNMDFSISTEIAQKQIGTRYDGKLKKLKFKFER